MRAIGCGFGGPTGFRRFGLGMVTIWVISAEQSCDQDQHAPDRFLVVLGFFGAPVTATLLLD